MYQVNMLLYRSFAVSLREVFSGEGVIGKCGTPVEKPGGICFQVRKRKVTYYTSDFLGGG